MNLNKELTDKIDEGIDYLHKTFTGRLYDMRNIILEDIKYIKVKCWLYKVDFETHMKYYKDKLKHYKNGK